MRRESGSKSHAQSRERETEEFCSHNLQNLAALIGLGGVENGRSTSLLARPGQATTTSAVEQQNLAFNLSTDGIHV